MARSLSEPLNEAKQQRGLPVRHAVNNDRVNGGLDMTSSDFIHGQRIVDNAGELPSPGDWKDGSRESVESHADLVYACDWTTSRGSCQDSGCMSDLSSGGGNSPATTVSPQSLINDQVSDDDYALTKHLGEVELEHNEDDKPPTSAGGSGQPGLLAQVPAAVTRTWAPSVPRYVRPMREIPPRFQRLLAAEVERVVRLCQRLNGSPLYSAATPSNSVPRQPTTSNGREASSSTSQTACIDKAAHAGQSAYTAQSPLIYVTAQSSGLPVYPPPASLPVNGCSSVNTTEPTSYVVPVGMAEPPMHGCGSGLAEGPPPSLPMFMANPVFFYPSAMLPPPDVESALLVMPVAGCPQPGAGTMQESTHSQSGAALAKNSQSNTPAAAVVGVFESAPSDDACSAHSGFYYSPPCPDLLPCCPLQMMQA